jgi:hypothetical protein
MQFKHPGLLAVNAILLDRTFIELLNQLPVYIRVEGDRGHIVVV